MTSAIEEILINGSGMIREKYSDMPIDNFRRYAIARGANKLVHQTMGRAAYALSFFSDRFASKWLNEEEMLDAIVRAGLSKAENAPQTLNELSNFEMPYRSVILKLKKLENASGVGGLYQIGFYDEV